MHFVKRKETKMIPISHPSLGKIPPNYFHAFFLKMKWVNHFLLSLRRVISSNFVHLIFLTLLLIVFYDSVYLN